MKQLDCKHKPSKHSKHTTGTAHTRDGREICWKCAVKEKQADILKLKHYSGYLNRDCTKITTWTGGLLGMVYYKKNTHRFGNPMIYFRFRAADGSAWWGLGMGGSMYANLHKYN